MHIFFPRFTLPPQTEQKKTKCITTKITHYNKLRENKLWNDILSQLIRTQIKEKKQNVRLKIDIKKMMKKSNKNTKNKNCSFDFFSSKKIKKLFGKMLSLTFVAIMLSWNAPKLCFAKQRFSKQAESSTRIHCATIHDSLKLDIRKSVKQNCAKIP